MLLHNAYINKVKSGWNLRRPYENLEVSLQIQTCSEDCFFRSYSLSLWEISWFDFSTECFLHSYHHRGNDLASKRCGTMSRRRLFRWSLDVPSCMPTTTLTCAGWRAGCPSPSTTHWAATRMLRWLSRAPLHAKTQNVDSSESPCWTNVATPGGLAVLGGSGGERM